MESLSCISKFGQLPGEISLSSLLQRINMAKILLVDEEAWAREVYLQELIEKGHRVVATRDPKSIGKEIASFKPDLVLLDLILGKADGWKILKDIKTLDSNLSVIIFSAHDTYHRNDTNLSSGEIHFIKDIDTKELHGKLGAALTRRGAHGRMRK
jgi:DNA-binding response OmpR family regulator